MTRTNVLFRFVASVAFSAVLLTGCKQQAGEQTSDIKFVGIDAIPEEGCMWVKNGQLAATFVYPPPGVQGLHAALKILNGEEVPKRMKLPTQRITPNTVDGYLASLEGGDKGESSASPTIDRKVVIGFSQCTTVEPWRALFNRLLIAEADKMPNVELVVLDAQDRTEKQVQDMETLINRKVDAILISPKEAPGLTKVVEDATKAGIPVVVLDRDVNTKDYACFIGGDNMEIGREAGRYAVEALGGAGKAKGFIYEIWGGMGSTPAQERHDGFHEIVGKEAGIKVEGNQDGDWKQDKGFSIMETALKRYKNIGLVYAHNDPMAFGAYLAAKAAGRVKEEAKEATPKP